MKKHFPRFSFFTSLLVLYLFAVHPGCCQETEPPLLKLPAHTDVAKVSWWKTIYLFPNFQAGKVTLATGFTISEPLKLNYNLYYAQMDLINEQGDTVQLKTSREIKVVTVGEHIFFHDETDGYVQVIYQAPVALGVVNTLNTEKMVYVSGNVKGSSEVDHRGVPSIYDRYYARKNTYYFIDQKNELHKTTKRNILQLFSGYKEKVNSYLKENAIDFSRMEDLVRLVTFCNKLDNYAVADSTNYFQVKAGQSIWGAIGTEGIFRFPKFQPARITFTGGAIQDEAKVNYNFYTETVESITKDGDTIKIRNPKDILEVSVGGTAFIHDDDQGFVEVLLTAPVSLCVHQLLAEQVAGNREGKSTVAAEMVSASYYQTYSLHKVLDRDRLYLKQVRYFFMDKRNKLYPASKTEILNLFPGYESTIASYIRENSIDFQKEKDLIALTRFCTELRTFR